MHLGKDASALHPEDGDTDVGDEDEEDDDGGGVVQAVQALLVGLFVDVSPSCKKHKMYTHTPKITNYTEVASKVHVSTTCNVSVY